MCRMAPPKTTVLHQSLTVEVSSSDYMWSQVIIMEEVLTLSRVFDKLYFFLVTSEFDRIGPDREPGRCIAHSATWPPHPIAGAASSILNQNLVCKLNFGPVQLLVLEEMAAVLRLGSLRASVSAGVEVSRAAVAGKSTESLRCYDGLRASVFANAKRTSEMMFSGYGSRKVAGSKLRVAAVLDVLQKVVESSSPAREAFAEMCAEISRTRAFRNASVLAMNVVLAMPALAEEEKGKIFDFNLTLPIIAVQFLLLMVALDTIWFKPVAAVMDERDANIRAKLLGVRDNSGEIKKLTDDAEALIKAARVETTLALNKTKRETAAVLEAKLAESRARIEKELALALANLEEKKEETLRSLDTQVSALSDQILQKVIPFKI